MACQLSVLASNSGIGRGQAQEYVDLYFDRYPGVRNFMDNIREQARQTGFRRNRIWPATLSCRKSMTVTPSGDSTRNEAQSTAPMQGTAADIIKRAMVTVQDWLLEARKCPHR